MTARNENEVLEKKLDCMVRRMVTAKSYLDDEIMPNIDKRLWALYHLNNGLEWLAEQDSKQDTEQQPPGKEDSMEFETNCFPENMSHCVSVLRKKYPGSLVVVGEPQGRDPCKLSRMAEAGWLGLSVCGADELSAAGEGGGEWGKVVKFECSQIEASRIVEALGLAKEKYRESSRDWGKAGNLGMETDHAKETDACSAMASQILALLQHLPIGHVAQKGEIRHES